MKIGSVELKNNIIQAPMAGVSDLPFRVLCCEQGAGMTCMEMISDEAVVHHNRNTKQLLEIDPAEECVTLQIFGRKPETMSEAVRMIQETPYHILDINMGCPVPKIVKDGKGSALMKEPLLVGQIVETLVKVSDKPVTVKIRSGFDPEHINAPEIAHIAEESGASAVTVHARTREQGYSGEANREVIRSVKDRITIPVIGNGDVTDPLRARSMIEETGCDGVMIGRGLQGNPWLMGDVIHYLEKGCFREKPGDKERMEMILRHGRMLIDYKGEYTGIREMRKHISWYTAGYPHSAALRRSINEMETYEQMEEAVRTLFARMH